MLARDIVFLLALSACGARTQLGAPLSTTDGGAGALRQVAPLSTSIVRTRKPTFHWTGAIAARLEVCRDRACQTIEASIDGNGSSATLEDALAPGVHFWRLHPVVNGKPTSATTATWEFRVPHASTRDTSWGVFPDFDGDGFADLVVSSQSEARTVSIYPGSPSGVQQIKRVDVGIPVDDVLGGIAVIGDIDGDGFGDLAIASAALPSQQGVVYIYRGGPGGLDPIHPAYTIHAPSDDAGTVFGNNIVSAGDLDGDGYADVIVTQQNDGDQDTPPGSIRVYSGGPNGPSSSPSITLHGNGLGGLTSDVAEAGDFDGDGFPDLVFAAQHAQETGKPGIYLYRGGPAGPSDASRTLIATLPIDPNCFAPPFSLTPGDLNGDGFADVVTGLIDCSPNGIAGRDMVIYGGPNKTTTILTEPPGMDGSGHALQIAWDIDGDGFDDLVAGASTGDVTTGGIVYWGSPSGVSDATRTTFGLESNAADPNGFAVTASDLDGDGLEDVTIATMGASKVATFSGNATSLVQKTSVTPPGATQFYEPMLR